jgi:serine/threonine protein phosphatase 1
VALLDRLRKKPLAGTKGGVARSYPAGKRMYCIGDIHGRADLLEALHAQIREDSANFDGVNQLLYLGDFIDRGDDSKRVIDILISQPLPDFEYIYLLGNHEHAMLNLLADPESMAGWLHWGGRETLTSYGIQIPLSSTKADLIELRALLERATPANHIEFLENCTLSHSEGSYYFVHAGIRPGVKLERQDYQDQLWIRDAFTRSTRDHGAVVVHGHSISEKVEFLPNRIGIDTGAYYSGVLTCLVLEGEDQRLLQTGGPS